MSHNFTLPEKVRLLRRSGNVIISTHLNTVQSGVSVYPRVSSTFTSPPTFKTLIAFPVRWFWKNTKRGQFMTLSNCTNPRSSRQRLLQKIGIQVEYWALWKRVVLVSVTVNYLTYISYLHVVYRVLSICEHLDRRHMNRNMFHVPYCPADRLPKLLDSLCVGRLLDRTFYVWDEWTGDNILGHFTVQTLGVSWPFKGLVRNCGSQVRSTRLDCRTTAD